MMPCVFVLVVCCVCFDFLVLFLVCVLTLCLACSVYCCVLIWYVALLGTVPVIGIECGLDNIY
jgi:hypothetical protein